MTLYKIKVRSNFVLFTDATALNQGRSLLAKVIILNWLSFCSKEQMLTL